MKKFKLVKSYSIEVDGKTLYRIKAIKNFGNVAKGQLGGYIEREENLSQDGDCWVHDDAMVMGYAQICDNAQVYDFAIVSGEAVVMNNVVLEDDAVVSQKARVYDSVRMSKYSKAFGEATLYDNAQLSGQVNVCGESMVCENVKLDGKLMIEGITVVRDDKIWEFKAEEFKELLSA